ncbi:MAG: hypothetical protein CMI03_15125 [Oceanospirillaceae bacterium]|uniref:hypothetical protein n=1 Tax=unclassified Thalassolituus TaxID=2624967 RepID=UPI000C090432|nr:MULTISPECIES: hypothetical protein [unclassified Thalassolituus]MAK90015.1 hypothetical protein [Thalassolituus sp.]MAS24301.1 hypothetical protein [Oceanospirillaceae bacterium]MBL36751.1 hypothetical protein [Oceanospirillaceae bacterium]MBS54071.1 hypothetical protein [Oceanospirillaceae bacterium]|tara:strand:+ start:906 stop:1244 length:339 start_codon:yes stop_codon:yes gene_type:complete
MSDMPKPLSETDLSNMLSDAESMLDEASHGFWSLSRLPRPELWQQHPWADEVCGFWVIAVMGKSCIYYNDLSKGFCVGQFSKWGIIDDYQPAKTSLPERLNGLFAQRSLSKA